MLIKVNKTQCILLENCRGFDINSSATTLYFYYELDSYDTVIFSSYELVSKAFNSVMEAYIANKPFIDISEEALNEK